MWASRPCIANCTVHRLIGFALRSLCIIHQSLHGKCAVLPKEEGLLQDPHIQAPFRLEELYSSQFELPFLKESHSFGFVHSSIYGAWYNGYMRVIYVVDTFRVSFFFRL